jgi:hypothetical protein
MAFNTRADVFLALLFRMQYLILHAHVPGSGLVRTEAVRT